jgi:drug/metabolite transporter (DMT)-like permease
MTPGSIVRLFLLAAIWGASFLFMRIAVPSLGPVLLVEIRVVLAALLLAAIAVHGRRTLAAGMHWRVYVFVGIFNTALPFLLFAWAAQALSASLLSIINAAAPIFGAVVGAIWLRQRPSAGVLAGLALGIAGVALLVGFDPSAAAPGSLLSVLAATAAPLCYGIASTYLKARAPDIKPFEVAHGSMWGATLVLAPLAPLFPAHALPGPGIAGAVLALGIVCTGIAYMLYFRLVQDAGPVRALTVTFLIPVFGVLWGHLILAEPIGPQTFAGAAIVIVGTALATGFSPRSLLPARGGKG